MVEITLKIPAALAAVLESFRLAHRRPEIDPLTGVTSLKLIYPSLGDLVRAKLFEVGKGLVRQYPTPELKAKLQQIEAIEKAIDAELRLE